MSTTEFYTGTIENVTVSENSGSWSATHGYNTTYSTGWRRTFAVSNPDAFPGIKPEDEGVTWVIMGIYPTDSNMLDMTQKNRLYPIPINIAYLTIIGIYWTRGQAQWG